MISRWLVPGSLAVLLFAHPPGSCLAAASDTWIGFSPPRTNDGSAIYDPLRHRMIVIRPYLPGRLGTRDVWALSLDTAPTWTQLLVVADNQGDLGPDRSAIYDPIRHRVIVFDGAYANTLSLAGTPAWTSLNVPGGPPTRQGQIAVYDPVRDRMVIYGGSSYSTFYGDVWEMSLSGVPRWRQIMPSGPTPPARSYHSAIYDPIRGRLIILAGKGTCCTDLTDVWALTLSETPEWMQLHPSGSAPPALHGHAAVYDPTGDRMIVTNGADTWALSLEGSGAWMKLSTAGKPPGSINAGATIYDALQGRIVTFGPDLWALSLSGTSTWEEMLSAPSGRSEASVIFDPVHCSIVTFGGYDYQLRGDVWALSPSGHWRQVAPSGAGPSARHGHSAIYDPMRERMIIFGGLDTLAMLNDVWTLPLSGDPKWARLLPSGPSPPGREYGTAIYDPVRDRLIVFGGRGLALLDDVWALSLSGDPVWTQLLPSGAGPSARIGHIAVYDPNGDRMVVFGGAPLGDGDYGDTWALAFSGDPAWTQLLGGGPNRMFAAGVYDPVRAGVVVYGGNTWDEYRNHYQVNDDVWILSLLGTPAWSQPTAAPGTTPSLDGARYAYGSAYDAADDLVLLYGTWDTSLSGLASTSASPDSTAAIVEVEAEGEPLRNGDYLTASPHLTLRLRGACCLDVGESRVTLDGRPISIDAAGTDVQKQIAIEPHVADGPHVLKATLLSAGWKRVSATVEKSFIAASRLRVLEADVRPVPSRGTVRLGFTLTRPADYTIDLFDVTGRRLGRLNEDRGSTGRNEFSWDGRVDGREAEAGVYFYAIAAGYSDQRAVLRGRLVLLR